WYRTVLRHAHDAVRVPLAASAHSSMAKAHLLWGSPETAAVHSRAGLELAQWSGCWPFAGRAASRLADAEEQLGAAPAAIRDRHEAQSLSRRADFPSPNAADDAPSAHAVLTPTARGGWPRTRAQDHRRP